MLTDILTGGKELLMKVVKVTTKGQVTIPQEYREALGIDERSYLKVVRTDDAVMMTVVKNTKPLADDDPIWDLANQFETTTNDDAQDHDRLLAEGALKQWRKSL